MIRRMMRMVLSGMLTLRRETKPIIPAPHTTIDDIDLGALICISLSNAVVECAGNSGCLATMDPENAEPVRSRVR